MPLYNRPISPHNARRAPNNAHRFRSLNTTANMPHVTRFFSVLFQWTVEGGGRMPAGSLYQSSNPPFYRSPKCLEALADIHQTTKKDNA